MAINSYKTVNIGASAEIVEKKSRFIANVSPVSSEEQAQQFVETIKKKYYDARHNCYAYIVGEKGEYRKFSDDGEPGGTAGRPIFDVINAQELTNTVVVVTRYFGGILLGTGGLVRAYSKSAKEAIDAAGIAHITLFKELIIECDYTLSGKVTYEINQKGYIIKDTLYTDKTTFTVLCPYAEQESFAKRITDLTCASAKCSDGRDFFAKIVDGKIVE